MPRIVQNAALRGSQRWLQTIINDQPHVINRMLATYLKLPTTMRIDWRSPLHADDYAEYQDEAFLERLGIILPHRSLTDFWPRRGPVWDGLGMTERGDLLLVEAKSHIPELVSSAAAGEVSLARIRASLEETKTFLHASPKIDWTTGFYQYANRLAHLYLLREVNSLPAYLVHVYFVNHHEQQDPTTQAEWESALLLTSSLLGIRRHRLAQYAISVYFDVTQLTESTSSG